MFPKNFRIGCLRRSRGLRYNISMDKENESTEVEVTIKYRIRIPTEVLTQLEERDDSSATDLISVISSKIQGGDFKAVTQDDLFEIVPMAYEAFQDLSIESLDWEGDQYDWNWEGV